MNTNDQKHLRHHGNYIQQACKVFPPQNNLEKLEGCQKDAKLLWFCPRTLTMIGASKIWWQKSKSFWWLILCLFVCFFIFCFSFWFPVFKDEEYGRQREINRRNSDSVVYIKPKENEAAAVLSSLKTAEINFQRKKIETLESEIDRISKVYGEQEERDLEIQQLGHVADQPDNESDTDGMKWHNSW